MLWILPKSFNLLQKVLGFGMPMNQKLYGDHQDIVEGIDRRLLNNKCCMLSEHFVSKSNNELELPTGVSCAQSEKNIMQ